MQVAATETKERPNIVVRFFHRLWVVIRTYFVVIGMLVTLFPIALGYFLRSRSQADLYRGVELREDKPSSLLLDISGPIVEKKPDFSELLFGRLFGGEQVFYLPDIRDTMRRAAKDARVERLEIEFGAVSGTPAEFGELRRILAEFAASGKPVRIVLDEADTWSYFAAAVPGTSLVLNPTSSLFLPGPYFQLAYFAETLNKLGVSVDVLRAGRYKSAFEPLVANEPSAETLEEYGAMEASLRDYLVESVAAGRKKNPAVVRAWLQRGVFTPAEAVQDGLVDELGYAVGKTAPAEDRGAVVRFADYAGVTRDDPPLQEVVEGDGGIALIEAVGEISMNEAESAGSSISPRQMRRRLRWALETSDVKAVVLRISSPGGSAVASDLIWNDAQLLAQAKPVVVSMGAYAASGGYYIAAPARRIVAEPTTITGSIGVIGALPSFGPFKEKYGISFYTVTQSERAALLNPGDRLSAQDKALMEKTIEQTYDTFVDKVALGRNMPKPAVEALAQGRVYTGLEAKAVGLVDELGGMQAAFAAAKELAGFDTAKLYPVLQYQPEEFSLTDCLSGPAQMMRCLDATGTRLQGVVRTLTTRAVSGAGARPAPWPEELAGHAQHWAALLQGGEVLALWPGFVTTNLR